MMSLLCLLTVAVFAQSPAALDASSLRIGPPTTVIELDLGKLKGEFRRLAWSSDKTQAYLQTAEAQSGGSDKLHHYVVPLAGGAVKAVDAEPEWAREYWVVKSYKSAPGVEMLTIEVKTGRDSAKAAVPADGVYGTDVRVGLSNANSGNVAVGAIRLELLGETVGEFVDTKPIPGLTFSWGPESSGAIVYTDRDGRLIFLDRNKHKQVVAGVKDALLPAWTTDGARVAYLKKTGRKQYALVWSDVIR